MRFVRRIIILATIAGAVFAASAQAQQASVGSSTGPVEILRGGGRWEPLSTVHDLKAGDLIRSGTGGSARVLFDDGSVAVLASASLLRLDEMGKKDGRPRVLLRLLGGQVRASVVRGSGRFEVETPTAVVTVHGTEFIVTYNTDTAESEVVCVQGSVEVLGVLGVLGKPVILETGMGTVVRKGAFPAPPSPVPAEKLASLAKAEEGTVGLEDGLIASFTGADTAAVVSPPPPPAEPGEARRHSLLTRYKPVSKDAEIIDQSIQEYTLTPPGKTPPGQVTVIINP